jgi:hypothetical protein
VQLPVDQAWQTDQNLMAKENGALDDRTRGICVLFWYASLRNTELMGIRFIGLTSIAIFKVPTN